MGCQIRQILSSANHAWLARQAFWISQAQLHKCKFTRMMRILWLKKSRMRSNLSSRNSSHDRHTHRLIDDITRQLLFISQLTLFDHPSFAPNTVCNSSQRQNYHLLDFVQSIALLLQCCQTVSLDRTIGLPAVLGILISCHIGDLYHMCMCVYLLCRIHPVTLSHSCWLMKGRQRWHSA